VVNLGARGTAVGANGHSRPSPHADMTTKRLAELDERASQLEQRMAELRDELAAVQRESVSAARSSARSRSSIRLGKGPAPLRNSRRFGSRF
jgi:hypothetical protein